MPDYDLTACETEARAILDSDAPAYGTPEAREQIKRCKAIETAIRAARQVAYDEAKASDCSIADVNSIFQNATSDAWALRSRRLDLQTVPLPVADQRDLPARMLTDADPIVSGPTETSAYAAGDLVVIYSRGGLREAIVVSTGKTKIEVAYTTATALREAAEHNWPRPTVTRKTVATSDVYNWRPGKRAAAISEEENMAGKPDPKPTTPKTSSGRKSKTATSTSSRTRKAASKPEATPETTPEPTPETETTPETAPEPVVELPTRDESPADLATSVVEYVEEATEATIERVLAPSGGEERFRVNGATVAYVAVGKRGVSVKVGLKSGERERITVKTSDDVAAAGRSLVETLGQLAAQTPAAQEAVAS